MRKRGRRLRAFLCYLLIAVMLMGNVQSVFAAAPATERGSAESTAKPGLTAKRATLLVGEKVTITLEGAQVKKVTSKKKAVATVTKDGVVTGKKPGKSVLTYVDTKGKKYTCKVTVKAGLSKKNLYVTKGKTASVKLCGAKIKTVKSNKPKIAKINRKKKNTFVVNALEKGTAKIKVKASNKKTYSMNAYVETPKLSEESVVLALGDTKQLNLQDTKQSATWSSDKISVVTVDEEGLVKTFGAGEATITATDESGASYTCKVTVEEPRFESGEITMTEGETREVKLSSNTQKVTWSSSDASVASVDQNGTVTAKKAGSAEIIATLESGKQLVLKVKVEAKPAGSAEQPKPEPQPPKTEKVDVKIDTGSVSGNSISVKVGTKVGDIPQPELADGETFLGWYSDSERTVKIPDDEIVSGSMTLYAKTMKVGDDKPTDVSETTCVSNVDTTFTIKVKSSDESLTAQQVMDQIEVSDVLHRGMDIDKKEYCVKVTGGNGQFVISGQHILLGDTENPEANFESGGSYIIKLPAVEEGQAPVLTFDGYPDATREFDVNVKAFEQNNMALKDNVTVISVDELNALYDETDGTKKEVAFLDGELTTVDTEGNVSRNSDLKGSFVLTSDKAKDLHLGSVVSLFKGMRPEEALVNSAGFEDGDNHVVYVEITGVKDNEFTFKAAEASDVLKTPEILPLDAESVTYYDDKGNVADHQTEIFKYGIDLDLDDSAETLEIPVAELDWSSDMYASAKLDSETTLDEGDFIAFYTGDYSQAEAENGDFHPLGYEKVIEVVKTGLCDDPNGTGDKIEYLCVKTEEASLQDIADSGKTHQVEEYDLYDDMSAEELVDLQQAIEEQFEESHYVEQTAVFLARTAIATDKFKDITGLDDFENYDITLTSETGEEYTEAQLMSSASGTLYDKYKDVIDSYDQSVDKDHPKWAVDVTVAKSEYDVGKSKHVKGGLGVKIGEFFTITVHMPTGDMKIEVHMDITQEVSFNVGFDGEIEWKKIGGFIPIPVDLILEPSFEVGSYTGFDITTAMVGKGKDNDEFADIGAEIKRLCEEFADEDPDKAEGISNYVTGKYQRLLEQNTELVNLLNLRVKKFSYPIIPGIVKLHIDIFLRIYGDMDIFGLHYHYLTGKKTIIYIHIIKFGVNTESIETIPTELDFYVYLMGTLSLRAGIAVEVTIGLTLTLPLPAKLVGTNEDGTQKTADLNLAKAGLGIEVGAYLDMSGLFYYHKNVKQGRTKEIFRGAQWSDIGIYVRLYLVADNAARNKKVRDWYSLILLDKKFPVKQIGTEYYPINFTTKQKDYKDVNMRQYVKKFAVPDAYYRVDRLKLATGKISNMIYDDQSAYRVELSNKDWAYDEKEHMVYLKGSFEGMESECDMTLYFTKNYLPLSATPMTRKLHIKWDNYLDGYAITPNSQGGSYVEASVGKFGVKVTKPEDPTRMGYVFTGWYTDQACTNAYTYPATMPFQSVDIYAGWAPATDTPYTVEYYLEDTVNGGYIYNSEDEFTGTTGEEIGIPAAAQSKFEGYDMVPSSTKVKISPDGSSVLRVYYDRKRAKITFTKGDKGTATDTITREVILGEPIYVPEVAAKGYQFSGWKRISGAGAANVTAKELNESRTVGTGEDEKQLSPGALDFAQGDATYEAQWAARNDINYRIEYVVQQPSGSYTVQAVTYAQGTPGDVISLDSLKSATITAVFDDGTGNERKVSGPADAILTAEDDNGNAVVEYESMTVDGQPCNGDAATVKADGSTIVKMNYKRKSYTVTVVGSGQEGDNSASFTRTAFYGAKVALQQPVKAGYTFKGYQDAQGQEVPVSETGFAVVKVTGDATYTSKGFKANTYTVAYDANGGTYNGAAQDGFTYGQEKALQEAPVKDGFEFAGWEAEDGTLYQAQQTVSNLTSTAGATVNLKAKWTAKGYAVTYNTNGGSIAEGSNPVSYHAEDEDMLLAYPVRDRFRFEGWYAGNEKITKLPGGKQTDLTLVAQWSEKSVSDNTIEVAFDPCGGTLANGNSIIATTGEAYGELPAATKDAAEFTGWYDARQNGTQVTEDSIVEKTDSHVLYAGWKYTEAKILYKNLEDADNGQNPVTYNIGEQTVIAAPSRQGYAFKGWTVGEDETLHETYVIDENATEDITLTANWEAEQYTLQLYSYSGLYLVRNYACDAPLTNIPMPKNSGYKLTGWKNMDTGEILNALPAKMPAKNLTLISQWDEAIYHLIPKNIEDGAVMEDYTYMVGDNNLLLPNPQKNKIGYNFAGWYTDSDFSETSKIESFVPVAFDVTVYAKWTAKDYTLIFNGNGGTYNSDVDYRGTYTYETKDALEANKFTKPGYIMKGWALSDSATEALIEDAKVLTKEQWQAIDGEAADDMANLFAVWQTTPYNITYNNVILTDTVSIDGKSITSTTAQGHPNQTTYTIEDDDLVLAPPTQIGDGYEFLGWYDGDTKVENLKLKGETGAKSLTAKWAHSGIYSIKLVTSTADSPVPDAEGKVDNNKTTFEITRTIPNKDKVSVSTDPQKIYFRTVNGTAIGGTATGINFYHVGGQNVFAVFSDQECYIMDKNEKKQQKTLTSTNTDPVSVTFDVTQENIATRYYGQETPREHNGVYALLYTLSGTNKKYYTAEIYRVASSLGNVTGVKADGKTEAKREMTVPAANVLTREILYGKKTYKIYHEDYFDDDSDFRYEYTLGNLITTSNGTKRFGDTALTEDMMFYLKTASGSNCKLGAQYECGRTKGKGYAQMKIRYYLNGSYLYQNNSNSDRPGSGRAWRDWTYANVTWDNLVKNNGRITYRGDLSEDNITYVKYNWYYWNFSVDVEDKRAPQQVGIAPAATTDYKMGDTVKFSVVYDEMINSVSDDIGADAAALQEYMPVTDVQYVDGVGTNVLTFTATASKDFSNTTWPGSGTNEELMKIKPVTGTVTDIY